MALCDERGSVAIDFRETPEAYPYIFENLAKHNVELLAHNAMFDALWPYRDFPQLKLNWRCTYAMYKYLASEDWIGQRHGLKEAQRDVLGWENTNDVELSRWLVDSGYVSSVSKEPKEGYLLVEHYGATGESRFCAPDKGEMWQAPKEVLFKYCALDAESTWLLYTYVLKPAITKFPVLRWYTGPLYQKFLELLLQNKFKGVTVDNEYLKGYELFLKEEAKRTFEAFIQQPDVASFRQLLRDAAILEEAEKEPPRVRKADIPREPRRARLNKNGSLNKQWESYESRLEEFQKNPPIAPSWLAWRSRMDIVEAEEHFNPNSDNHMRALLYGWIGKPVGLVTDTGKPATSKKVLRGFPEMNVLVEHVGYVKEISILDSLRGVCEGNEQGVLTYHPSFRFPRTSTGRLGGSGGFNFQNVKKSPIMHGFIAREEHCLWSFDFPSLEQIVMAELSRDPVLWEFYGPGSRKGNCLYLFEGSQYPILGEKIRESGYDPFNWTPESVEAAKDWCKKQKINWREVAKTFVLSGNYGAGGDKNHETLMLAGIREVSKEECWQIVKGRRELYAGVKKWENELRRQWKQNRGWVLNGIGRPQCVSEDFLKDIVNRVCQGTGHDLLVILICMIAEAVEEEGLNAYPWLLDCHDATYWEVHKSHVNTLTEVFRAKVLPRFLRYVRATIPLAGEPDVIQTLGEDKKQKRFWEVKQERGEELTLLEQVLADQLEELKGNEDVL